MLPEDYTLDLLNGLEERATIRIDSGLDARSAAFRTLNEDGVVREMLDSRDVRIAMFRTATDRGWAAPDEKIPPVVDWMLNSLDFPDDDSTAAAAYAYVAFFEVLTNRLQN